VGVHPETPYWWADLVSGVLLLLAAWVSTSDPQSVMARRTYLILFWVGFMALLRGFTQIMLAFSLRQLGTAAASGEPAVSGPGDASPVIPAQERRGVGEVRSAQ
jgi:uncharacterized membrane protein HdeD (DUF308 family)